MADAAQPLTGRVAIVTGAGGGLGREHALALAEAGARVVVNDVGPGADETAELIVGTGGQATPERSSVADWEAGAARVRLAIETYGDLHIVINNAGITRDRMSFSMSEEEWDTVVDVHLKGHFVPAHHAAVYWRAESKEGRDAPRRLVHTTSESGLFGAPGQTNYGSAKGGILTLSLALARELHKYGVTSNVIAPRARTPMTANVPNMGAPEDPRAFDTYNPANVSPFVAWLCTDDAADVNGQTFIVGGSAIFLLRPYAHAGEIRAGGRWTIDGISANKAALFGENDPGIPPFDAPAF